MTDTIRSREEARVVGGAMLLLTSVLMGVLLAYVGRGFHGTLYIPLVTPCVLAWALGLVLARVCVRFQVLDPVPIVAAAVFAALIAYGGYHLLVYDRVVDFMVTQLTSPIAAGASSPGLEVQRFLEAETGERGFFAYLAFVSGEEHGAVHPLGMLGALRPGLTGTLIAMFIELMAFAGAAVWVTRWRGQGGLQGLTDASMVREVIAHTDGPTLRAAMEAMDRGDYEAAGRVLRRPDVDETFAVALLHHPNSAEDFRLEVLEGEHLRASRAITSWNGHTLWDALRVK